MKKVGYVLTEPLLLLQDQLIKQLLKEHFDNPIDLVILETVDSTNDYVKLMRSKNPIKICIAEQQKAGRGRFSRQWHSPFGQNIYMSCNYCFHKDLSELAGLSLVVGLAIIKTLNHFGLSKDISLKWPNDIRWKNQKLSGVLIEISADSHGACDAIIGIGLNVNMLPTDLNLINQAWTSLAKILNKRIDRNILSAILIANLIKYIREFELYSLAHFTAEWKKVDSLYGQQITLNTYNEEFTGKAVGINSQGHLLLQLTDGTERAFSSGEASIKKPNVEKQH